MSKVWPIPAAMVVGLYVWCLAMLCAAPAFEGAERPLPTPTPRRAAKASDIIEKHGTGGQETMQEFMPQIPLGLPGDEVLKRVGRPRRTRRVGLDPDEAGWLSGVQGKIYEWKYPWGVLVLKRRRAEDGSGPHCYRVVEKRAKDGP